MTDKQRQSSINKARAKVTDFRAKAYLETNPSKKRKLYAAANQWQVKLNKLQGFKML